MVLMYKVTAHQNAHDPYSFSTIPVFGQNFLLFLHYFSFDSYDFNT